MKYFALIAMVIVLSGCSSLQPVGNTLADSTLQADILQAISYYEGVRPTSLRVPNVTTATQRQGTYTEEWTVENRGKRTVYVVGMTPSPMGGVDIRVVRK